MGSFHQTKKEADRKPRSERPPLPGSGRKKGPGGEDEDELGEGGAVAVGAGGAVEEEGGESHPPARRERVREGDPKRRGNVESREGGLRSCSPVFNLPVFWHEPHAVVGTCRLLMQ